jgi:SAM-dependent methyltransferase
MPATHSVMEDIFDARLQAHFENNVELYVDKALACYEKASLLRLAQLSHVTGFRPSSNFRLLDVGCGGGFFLDLFLDKFPNASASGVDFSPAMLQANEPSHRKNLCQGDALHLPEECGDFEVINIDTVMHHLIAGKSYTETMAQIRECLRHLQSRLMPGGVICVREIYHEYFGPESFGSRVIFFLSTRSVPRIVERILKVAGIQPANAGVCFLTRKQWSRMFEEAGLSILSVEENAWTSQPYRKFGFKASGDIHYIVGPKRIYAEGERR